MTDLTADAIAALTKIIAANDRYVADTQPAEPDLLTDAINESRPVLDALLSAQGQAGKPVAWRVCAKNGPVLFTTRHQAQSYADMWGYVEEPIFVQPQPAAGVTDAYPTEDAYLAACRALEKHRKRGDGAEAKLTTARTALEDAEKALRNSLDVFSLLKEHAPDPAIVRPYIADVSVALRTASSALATIKGLET